MANQGVGQSGTPRTRDPQGGQTSRDESRQYGGKAAWPLVVVVVLNYNGAQLTTDCVNSVLKSDYSNYRVIVVDNASADGSAERLKTELTDSRVELFLNDKNEGYAGGNNRGIEKALEEGAEYVFVLNNDTIADPGCLRSLVAAMEGDPLIGIAGCQIVDVGYEFAPNRGHRISLFSGQTLPPQWSGSATGPTDVGFVCGAAMVLRALAVRKVGAFDSDFFLYFEDADICLRARKAGYRTCFIPGPGVQHFMSSTTNDRCVRTLVTYCRTRNQVWLVRRHGRLGHRIVFAIVTFVYQLPRMLLAIILRGQFDLLRPVLKGVLEGYMRFPAPPEQCGSVEIRSEQPQSQACSSS